MSLYVASYQAKPHDASFLGTLVPIQFCRGDLFGHIIAPYRNESRFGKKLFCTLRDQIQLPKAELLRSSKEALKERRANSSASVLWLDNYRSQKAPQASNFQRDGSDDGIAV